MPNFTPENLLLYMYNEMNEEERSEMERELQKNWSLNEKLLVLKEAEDRLNKMSLKSPRQKTVDAILQYVQKPSEVQKPL